MSTQIVGSVGTATDGYLAQVVLQGSGGLPEDRYVTTTHWSGTGAPSDAQRSAIATRLSNFWTATSPQASRSVQSLLSRSVGATAQVRIYTMRDQPPRRPATFSFPLTIGTGDPLPSELAVCLSFVAGRNVASRRGRIYIGPLIGGTTAVAFVGGHARPGTALYQVIPESARAFLLPEGTDGVRWVVRSRVKGELNLVTGGWCDDAFDVQRRRGVKPANRSTFGTL